MSIKGGGAQFANPFTLTNNDKRQLNSFFDDDDNSGMYEQVDSQHNADLEGGNNRIVSYNNDYGPNHSSHESDDDEEDEYEYGNGRPRRIRRDGNETLGSLMPNMFSTNHSSSVNVVYLTVLLSLIFCLVAYYGLSMKHNEKVGLEGNNVPSTPKNDDDLFMAQEQVMGDEDYGIDEIGPPMTYESSISNPNNFQKPIGILFNEASQPKMFDPLHIKKNNDWEGAPFVVSPPRIPVVVDDDDKNDDASNNINDVLMNGRRLGYIQNPTVVNGTIVFSTEGDLYLTRYLPSNNNKQQNVMIVESSMTAMKLTTTIGNALHPKLNPKYPYLLVYSATYSGTREVYLMDLRSSTTNVGKNGVGILGSPGTPGGPALRLTYTPGGILSVVGWTDDGTSILYSSMSVSSKSLPDVRLFRLRLSWGGGGGGSSSEKKNDDDVGDVKVKIVKEAKAEEEKEMVEDEKDDEYTIEEAQSYVDELTTGPADDDESSKAKVASKDVQKNSEGDSKKKKKDANEKNKKKKDNDAHQRRLEKQRQHLAKLSQSRSLGKKESSIHSILEQVPLAQATEGVEYSDCIYFTQFKQSSNTKRYVGGTAESLW